MVFKSTIITFALLVFTLIQLIACKTTEEVRKEKMLEDISTKVNKSQNEIFDSKKIFAQHQQKFAELEVLLNKNHGSIEEMRHQQTEDQRKSNERITLMENKLVELLAITEEHKEEIKNLLQKSIENKKYLEEVISTLSKLQNTLESRGKKRK